MGATMSSESSRGPAGVIAAGNFILDNVKTIDSWPKQDSLANIGSEEQSNGGGPYNVLKDLSKLGAGFPLAAAGLIGDDAAGAYIRKDLESHGVDTSSLHVTPLAPTSYTDVMAVGSTGRRTFFHQRGANALMGPEHVQIQAFPSYRHFHFAYALLLDRMDAFDANGELPAATLLETAKRAGLKTSVDTVSAVDPRFAKVINALLPHTDILIINEFEAEQATGISTTRDDDIDLEGVMNASEELVNRGSSEWVVIHFSKGALARNQTGEVYFQGAVAMPSDAVVGAVGAGDAFCAGFLFGSHEGLDIRQTLETAVCVAASCLTGATTSGGIMPLEKCLQMGRAYGYSDRWISG